MGNCMQSSACGCMRTPKNRSGVLPSSRGSSRKPLVDGNSHGRPLIEDLTEKKVEGGDRGVLRVKVLLTKAEAELLLSKGLADSTGMILERLASELAEATPMPERSQSFGGAWRPALESIPEVL